MTILTHNSHDEEARRLRAEIDAGRKQDWLDNTSAERAAEDVQPWQLDEIEVTP